MPCENGVLSARLNKAKEKRMQAAGCGRAFEDPFDTHFLHLVWGQFLVTSQIGRWSRVGLATIGDVQRACPALTKRLPARLHRRCQRRTDNFSTAHWSISPNTDSKR